MKLSYLLSIILALLATVSCSKDIPEDTSMGSIEGSVSDRTTGEPVSTVNVTLTPGGNSTVTGSDGTFSFHNLDDGEYSLEISKKGYKSNSSKLYVRSGEPTPAHLLIERIPAIVTADRETLDFGDNQSLNTLSFNIVNSGYEDLEWEIEERCEWITEIKPEKGTLAYGKTDGIIVVIDRDKLNSGENKAVIVIQSSNGSSQMNVIAIGAERVIPTLNTLATTNVTFSTATFNGEITNVGTPAYTERGFVFSLNPMPTLENTIEKLSCTVTPDKKFSYNISGLTPAKTYYVRAYAKNSAGTAYSSNETKFSTPVPLPVVSALDISNVDFSNGTATFRGQISDVGVPPYTERGFVYSTLPEPTVNDNKIVANGAGVLGSFSKYVSGLPKTTYYVRAYATNSIGTAYGEEKIVESEWVEIPAAGIAVQRKDIGKGYWYSVKSMCENSTLGGFTDWRLPTKEELMVLYNNREMIGGFESDKYWSSTYNPGSFGHADLYYYINFVNGDLSTQNYTSYSYYARAVRTITK